MIETKRTGSAEYGRWIKALVCGEPGSGKTLISSTFPEPFFASAEGGLMSIADRDIPYVQITSTDQLHELLTCLKQDPKPRERLLGTPVQTVVIDTIDEVQRIFIQEKLTKERKATLTLQDYGWLGDQMKSLATGFRNLDMNVVFTCHLKETKDEELGRIIYKPGLVGQFSDQVPGYVDLALVLTSRLETQIVANKSRRVLLRNLQTFPDNQHPWIKDRSGKLPQELEVNFTDDYARMHGLIFKGIPDVELPDPPTATVAEILEITEPEPESTPVEPLAQAPATEGKFECAECHTMFDDEDQAALSRIRRRTVLCKPCYQAA